MLHCLIESWSVDLLIVLRLKRLRSKFVSGRILTPASGIHQHINLVTSRVGWVWIISIKGIRKGHIPSLIHVRRSFSIRVVSTRPCLSFLWFNVFSGYNLTNSWISALLQLALAAFLTLIFLIIQILYRCWPRRCLRLLWTCCSSLWL